MKERFSDTHSIIYGNGLKAPASPGVDPKEWKYNSKTNNYDFIGKDYEIIDTSAAAIKTEPNSDNSRVLQKVA